MDPTATNPAPPAGRIAFATLVLGLVLLAATLIAASTWERVRTHPKGRSIEVTGSAKKRILSDQIEWSAHIQTDGPDRAAAYRSLAGHVKTALAYHAEQGVPEKEIRASAVQVEELVETEVTGTGAKRIERQVF
jgi:hypothetical protein